MALLNYTTTITTDKTLGEIQRLLAKHGARSILTDFDREGEPIALSFLIETPFGERGFKLPANIDAVLKVLSRQYSKGQVQRRFVSREQASRVGWRILKDWVEAQMAIVETEMVSMDQVFLPFLRVDREGGATLYDVLRAQHLALPGGGGLLALPTPREG